jgi:hypothetical protein
VEETYKYPAALIPSEVLEVTSDPEPPVPVLPRFAPKPEREEASPSSDFRPSLPSFFAVGGLNGTQFLSTSPPWKREATSASSSEEIRSQKGIVIPVSTGVGLAI